MATIYTEVAVDVELNDFSTEDLIDELEERGYTVQGEEESKALEDRIRDLKEDFLLWKDFGMKNENFEKVMKDFFLDTIDEYIS